MRRSVRNDTLALVPQQWVKLPRIHYHTLVVVAADNSLPHLPSMSLCYRPRSRFFFFPRKKQTRKNKKKQNPHALQQWKSLRNFHTFKNVNVKKKKKTPFKRKGHGASKYPPFYLDTAGSQAAAGRRLAAAARRQAARTSVALRLAAHRSPRRCYWRAYGTPSTR